MKSKKNNNIEISEEQFIETPEPEPETKLKQKKVLSEPQ